MTDPSWSQLLLADVRDIKELLGDLSMRVNRNELAQASMEQQLKSLQRAPETIRNWGTFALYALGSVASGFGCMGCLGSTVSLLGAVVAVVIFFTTHH